MATDSACGARASGPSDWNVWGNVDDLAENEESRWLDRLRLDSFRFLMGMTIAALMLLAVRFLCLRGFWEKNYLINAVLFLWLFCLVSWKPAWHRPLSWVGIGLFLASAFIQLGPSSAQPIVPTHVLLPLIVLYAALLGDIWMGAVATVGVLALYLKVGLGHWPLERRDLLILMDLCGTAVLAGFGTFGVWLQHRRFVESHRSQAASLRRELDARLRLNAILFHDIRNPLGALTTAIELAKENPAGTADDLGLMEQMVNRIWAVIDSAREVGRDVRVELSVVPVEQLWAELDELFASRLKAKDLTLARADGGALTIWTHRDILFGSVLGNIMNNAIKFSPRGSAIEFAASVDEEHVRIEVRDCGEGFPADVLKAGSRGSPYDSGVGTEGETGHAYGLRIAALCLHRLGGQLQIRNRPGGGASVAVVLPRGDGPMPNA